VISCQTSKTANSSRFGASLSAFFDAPAALVALLPVFQAKVPIVPVHEGVEGDAASSDPLPV
jgi:hypothetical protein